MNDHREHYECAAGRSHEHPKITPLQPSKNGAGLLLGILAGLIAISPAIVKWLMK